MSSDLVPAATVDTLLALAAETECDTKRAALDRLHAVRECNGGFLRYEDYAREGARVGRTGRTLQAWMRQDLRRLGKPTRARHRHKPVLTDLIVATYYAHGGRIRSAYRDLMNHGFIDCSESTFARLIHSMPESLRQYPNKGHEALVKFGLYVLWTAARPNQVQHLDSHRVDQPCIYQGRVIFPWTTDTEDDHTRLVAGLVLSTSTPTANDVACAIAVSMRIRTAPDGTKYGGRPKVVVVDNATINTAAKIVDAAAEMDIKLFHCAAYSPWSKGKKERWYRSYEEEALGDLYGHTRGHVLLENGEPFWVGSKDGLPSFEMVEERTRRFLTHYNFTRPHGGLGGQTPIQAWNANQVDLQEPPRELIARAFLETKQATYKVHHFGLAVHNGRYVGDCLAMLVGKQVKVRYMPDDDAFVEVFSANDDTYYGPAWEKRYATPELVTRVRGSRDAVATVANEYRHIGLAVIRERTLLEAEGISHSFSELLAGATEEATAAVRAERQPTGGRTATPSIKGMPGADLALAFDPNSIDRDDSPTH